MESTRCGMIPKSARQSIARWALFAGIVSAVAFAVLPIGAAIFGLGQGVWQHIIAFGVLAFSAAVAYPSPRSHVKIGIALIAFGGLLEAAQMYVPGRWPNFTDVVINALATILGLLVARLARTVLSRQRYANPGPRLEWPTVVLNCAQGPIPISPILSAEGGGAGKEKTPTWTNYRLST